MANEQNLTPWKPGQSGNPSGVSSEVHQMRQRTNEIMAKVQLAQAEKLLAGLEKPGGDKVVPEITTELTGFADKVADRAEGKAAQSIKHDAEPGGALAAFLDTISGRTTKLGHDE